jgi:hypothetical protein
MNAKRFSAIIYIFFLYFLFCTHEKIILRIPLESENKLKIILQILSQTCCQAIATRALRALVSIAWQQVFENLSLL